MKDLFVEFIATGDWLTNDGPYKFQILLFFLFIVCRAAETIFKKGKSLLFNIF